MNSDKFIEKYEKVLLLVNQVDNSDLRDSLENEVFWLKHYHDSSISDLKEDMPIIIKNRIARSLALHRAIVIELRKNPDLWSKPMDNIKRWRDDGIESDSNQLWENILTTKSQAEIIEILLSKSEKSVELRKSSPFVGIIPKSTRDHIFKKYSLAGDYLD